PAPTVTGSIGSLKVTVGRTVTATLVAPLAGEVEDTVGAVRSGAATVRRTAACSKVEAIAEPARSFTPADPPMTWIRWTVSKARLCTGTIVAVVPAASSDGEPAACATAAPPGPSSLSVVDVTVVGSIDSLNLAVGRTAIGTPVAPSAGLVEDTVGMVMGP